MSKMNDLKLNLEELMDNTQKFVLCGRAMLDAIEEIATLVAASSISTRSPEASGELGHSAAAPLSSQTRVAGLCDEETKEAEPQVAEAPKTATMEEVRGLLAEKSRSGFRAEVKALLTAHGVEKLSEITDPVELGKLQEEAGKIGATG